MVASDFETAASFCGDSIRYVSASWKFHDGICAFDVLRQGFFGFEFEFGVCYFKCAICELRKIAGEVYFSRDFKVSRF